MAREESRSRIIEDGSTGDNLAVNPDGSINVTPAAGTSGVVQIESGDGSGDKATVTPSKELLVKFVQNSVPAGNTAVDEGNQEEVDEKGDTDNYDYTIPSGETFVLNTFEFGGYVTKEDTPLQAKCDLYWRPNGNGVGQVLIATIYLQGQSNYRLSFIDKEYVGDGTAELRMTIENWSAEPAEFTRFIRGYY